MSSQKQNTRLTTPTKMPACLHCNRVFVNKEALHQHVSSSSIAHPLCEICDRRFISDVAREAHMASKHPPMFDCTLCTRTFSSPGALDDHYRGSAAHPNCSKCGKGFKDFVERQEHHISAHVPIPCGPCGGAMIDQDAQEAHFLSSPNHPTCLACARAFKDKDAYVAHIDSVHSEQGCEPRHGEEVGAGGTVKKHNVEMLQGIYRGPTFVGPRMEIYSPPKFAEKTDGRPPPSFVPFKITKDSNSKYAPDETRFAPRIVPPIQPQIPNPPLLPTKFSVSLAIDQRVTTPRQPSTPRIPIKSLPPPSAAVNSLWGAYENVQLRSSVAPPRFSRRLESGAQLHRLAMGGPRSTNGGSNLLTGLSEGVSSWTEGSSNTERLFPPTYKP